MESETLKVEWVSIAKLFCNPANPRLNDEAVPHVASSIRRFGWRQPKRRSEAATCGSAGSFRRGFEGLQKRRSSATHSTSRADVSTGNSLRGGPSAWS